MIDIQLAVDITLLGSVILLLIATGLMVREFILAKRHNRPLWSKE